MADRVVSMRRSTIGTVRRVFSHGILMKDLRPLFSASWKRSSTGTGTNTQFSGLGKTPTGELGGVGVASASGYEEVDTSRPDKSFNAGLLPLLNSCVYSDMNSMVGRCLLRVKVLNKSRVGIQI